MAERKARGRREQNFKDFTTRPPHLRVLSDLPLDCKEARTDCFELPYRVGPVYDIIRHPDASIILGTAPGLLL